VHWKLWFVVYSCLNWTTGPGGPLCEGTNPDPDYIDVRGSIAFNSKERCEDVGRKATSGMPWGLVGFRCRPLLDEKN
jgi:hypothetical protein